MSLLASYSYRFTRSLLIGDGGKRPVFRTSMARLAGRKTARPQPKQRVLDLRKRQLDPNLLPAEIDYENSQRLIPVDNKAFLEDFSLWLCSSKAMIRLNFEEREKRKNTDILSFPAMEALRPEVLIEDDDGFLGDIVISPQYVKKVISRDQEALVEVGEGLDEDDAGVSKAMANVFDVQERLPLLMIHGLLHLLGYDHETEDDWKLMTSREDEVIKEFRRIKASVNSEEAI
eukprot:scaffold3341_cov165-Ochromonas_danica.AAC.9